MKSFEDSWKENRHVFESTRNLAKAMYLDGQQSKQAEVDELRKRIDQALIELEEAYRKGVIEKPRCIIDSMKILKGDQS